jgi:hypothetical protein
MVSHFPQGSPIEIGPVLSNHPEAELEDQRGGQYELAAIRHHIPTDMDYDCVYPDQNNNQSYWAYQFQTLDVDFGNALPIADANGPYNVDCEGTTTTVDLDGSASIDLEGPLSFSWTTTCPGGSFDNATLDKPVLTVNTAPGCSVPCSVSLTVTDGDGATDTNTANVTISDADAPVISGPTDVTIGCDESTDPSHTGYATATDGCDPAPTITYTDVETAGACSGEKTIVRTWTATDACGHSSSYVQTITVQDTTPPVVSVPADVTIECDESADPSHTGSATASDNCDTAPTITYADVETAGACPEAKSIARTWMATDACGNTASGLQTVTVVDSTAPVISCNIPATITPPDAPIPFTATAADNCDDDPAVQITEFDCFKFTAKGKRIDKTQSCVVDVVGNSITVLDTGGVGTYITWDVLADDNCGNMTITECEVEIVKQGGP